MPTQPVSDAERASATTSNRPRVLVRTSTPPRPTDRYVDVRPGGSAAFDGDRVRLALSVWHGGSSTRVDWADRAAIETVLGSAIGSEASPVVRFGDRRAVRAALGMAHAETLERWLGTVAAEHGATLLVWTSATRRPGDHRSYDLVVDGTESRFG